MPGISRALKRIYHFKDLGQDLQLSCYKCQCGGIRKSPSLTRYPIRFRKRGARTHDRLEERGIG